MTFVGGFHEFHASIEIGDKVGKLFGREAFKASLPKPPNFFGREAFQKILVGKLFKNF